MNADVVYRRRQSRAGTKGGLATKKKHGTKFFAAIARKRWKKWRVERVIGVGNTADMRN